MKPVFRRICLDSDTVVEAWMGNMQRKSQPSIRNETAPDCAELLH